MITRAGCMAALVSCSVACSSAHHGSHASGSSNVADGNFYQGPRRTADGGPEETAHAADAAPPPGPCDGANAASPIEYGQCELAITLADAGNPFAAAVLLQSDPRAGDALAEAGAMLPSAPESFAIALTAGAPVVIGSDDVGAMYGAFELAERIRLDGVQAAVASLPLASSPAVPLRAANLFLVLPAPGETTWWFLDVSFWREYLNMVAHARLDFLDLHAMYDLDNTIFPNALLYFGTSPTYPNVGVPAADRARNAAMLVTITQMAAARGIRVGLMTYRSDTSPTGDGAQALTDDTALRTYTREATRDVATHVPGLWKLGFRIGESLKPATWYADTFVAGILDAKSGATAYTRTWLSNKADILKIAAAAQGNFIVEAKLNGEHLGPPYPIAGGLMATWGSYSYEDYLDAPSPYDFVWQVRSGGTHRIFREASFARARRLSATYAMSGSVRGLTLEPPHAYFPQHHTYRAARDGFSPWAFRRDEIMYNLYGRLAYDPKTSERALRAVLSARVQTDALWDAMQAASDIVPWIQTAHTCGPDSRDFAPDLEWGGPVGYWASPSNTAPPAHACSGSWHGAFDSFSVATPYEAADDLLHGRTTTRIAPGDVAKIVLDDADRARAAASVALDPSNAEGRDLQRECIALADLGTYFGHKLYAATALAVYAGSGRADYLDTARKETALADSAWGDLARDTAYIAPFDDGLRMRTQLGLAPFHWSAEIPWLAADPASIDAFQAAAVLSPPSLRPDLPPASQWLFAQRGTGPGLAALSAAASPGGRTITATLANAPPAATSVSILFKRLRSTTDWQSAPATQSATGLDFTATVPADAALFAVEVTEMGVGWRYPDSIQETPYRLLPP
ncbi:MAG TPA: hypothetical protein VGY54_14270 [Polyangiaceae bacterium]|jgi:hypothetical protein|nr:hypothetical protein [Polyangiaceae bacterium]